MSTNSRFALHAVIGLLATAATSAAAQESQAFLEAMRSCASQTEDAARLRCYDHVVARFHEGGDSTRPAAGAAAVDAAKPLDQFGLTSGPILAQRPEEERPHPLKQMSAHVAALSHRPDGNLVLRLDNEQVWEQSEQGPDLRIAPGDSITIDRGALGSYWLSATTGRHPIKVRRVR